MRFQLGTNHNGSFSLEPKLVSFRQINVLTLLQAYTIGQRRLVVAFNVSVASIVWRPLQRYQNSQFLVTRFEPPESKFIYTCIIIHCLHQQQWYMEKPSNRIWRNRQNRICTAGYFAFRNNRARTIAITITGHVLPDSWFVSNIRPFC